MVIEELTINQYIKGWYNEDYKEIPKEQIDQAYCEYMDLSGLYETKRYQQLVYINYLTVRIAVMSTFVEVQRDYLLTFFEPFVDGFYIAKRYHHNLTWDGNFDKFLKELQKIEAKEAKYKLELKQTKHRFLEEETMQKHEQKSKKESRIEFLRNITVLRKNGYQIDREKTTMEEYGIIIRDTLQEQKIQDAAKSFKHRN